MEFAAWLASVSSRGAGRRRATATSREKRGRRGGGEGGYGSAATYTLGGLLVDGLLAGAVAVGAELGVLDEAALLDEGLELLGGHEEVVDAVLLAGARLARRVRHGQREGVGVLREEPVVERTLAHA